MGQASGSLHEPAEQLSPELIDRHRAIVSLMEELEAIDWYDQRVAACEDPELREILSHNRDEEKEHAAMTLEWLRRHDSALDQHLRKFLFREGPIAERETGAKSQLAAVSGDGSLHIGSLRQVAP
jgi:ferritin-like protein